MHPSVIIAQHEDLKMHPHTNEKVTIIILKQEL